MKTAILELDGMTFGAVQAKNEKLYRVFFDPEIMDDSTNQWDNILVHEMEKEDATDEDHKKFIEDLSERFGLEEGDPSVFRTVGLFDFIEGS